MDFWRVATILERRKWLILLSTLVTLGLTFLGTGLIGKKWQATVRLAATVPSAVSGQGDNSQPSAGPLANMIAKNQALIYESIIKTEKVLGLALPAAGFKRSEPFKLENISVQAQGTKLYELQVTDSSFSRAKLLANDLAQRFMTRIKELASQDAKAAVDELKTQRKKQDDKVADARRKFESYRRDHRIVSKLDDEIAPALARRQAAQQRRDDLLQRLAEAQARLNATRERLAHMPPTVPVERSVAASPLVTQLEQALADKEKELVSLRALHTDEHIEVRRAMAERDALASRLKAELTKKAPVIARDPNPNVAQVNRDIASLEQEIVGERAELATAETALSQADAALKSFTGVDSTLAMLSTELSQQLDARSALEQRVHLAEMALDAADRQAPVQIVTPVDDVNPPIDLTQSRTVKLLLLAALCGAIGTSGIMIALDGVDRRVKTVSDAERILPAPVVAAIPQAMGQVTIEALPRATETFPQSLHSEAYRFLGLHLLTNGQRRVRSLMAISAKAAQGTTNTVTNLGITLAQAGHRVVIVDANVRTPHLHQIFGLQNEFGFTDVVSDSVVALEDVLRATTVPNLRVITSGSACANPWELFRADRLGEFMRRLKGMTDYILFDTPSALAFSDALTLAPCVDGALLCVRALEVPSGAEEALVGMLREAHVTVLGSVLNDVPAAALDSYQSYHRYYPSLGAGTGGTATAVIDETQPDGVLLSSNGASQPGGTPNSLN